MRAGHLQCLGLGMDVCAYRPEDEDVSDANGGSDGGTRSKEAATGEMGELVCRCVQRGGAWGHEEGGVCACLCYIIISLYICIVYSAGNMFGLEFPISLDTDTIQECGHTSSHGVRGVEPHVSFDATLLRRLEKRARGEHRFANDSKALRHNSCAG